MLHTSQSSEFFGNLIFLDVVQDQLDLDIALIAELPVSKVFLTRSQETGTEGDALSANSVINAICKENMSSCARM